MRYSRRTGLPLTPRANPLAQLAVAPVYRVKVYGRLYSQLTINRFDFAETTGPTTVNELSQSFWPQVRTTWRNCVAPEWSLDHTTVEELTNTRTDFQEETFGLQPGIRVGVSAPPLVAISFYRGGAIRGQHGHGGFRLSGIPQEDLIGEGYSAGLKNVLQLFAVILGSPIAGTLNPATRFTPVIATPAGPPDAITGERPVRYARILAVIPDPRLTTQQTRRPRPAV